MMMKKRESITKNMTDEIGSTVDIFDAVLTNLRRERQRIGVMGAVGSSRNIDEP